jgi:hypothetical protein
MITQSGFKHQDDFSGTPIFLPGPNFQSRPKACARVNFNPLRYVPVHQVWESEKNGSGKKY